MLDNGLKVVLVSDPTTDKAAASLDVNIGSGSDPEGREGLAHFLEHMLFLGTEKYPNSAEYKEFMAAHGGGDNAYTSYDHTNYFFDIDKDYLEPALDRFAQFFVAPTFTPKYVSRERQVVHSEYTSKFKSDGRRSFYAKKQVMNPDHPYTRFSVGSNETLARSLCRNCGSGLKRSSREFRIRASRGSRPMSRCSPPGSCRRAWTSCRYGISGA